jgi:cytochrome c553
MRQTQHTTTRARQSLQRKALILGAALLFGAAAAWLASPAHAQGAEIFKDADIALGEKLIAEHKCVECHTRQVGGDGSSIYKPLGRINTAGLLRGMVEMCNTQMNLGLFPEEVTAVAAVINRDHYKFK